MGHSWVLRRGVEDQTVSTVEAAELLGVSEQFVRRQVRADALVGVRMRAGCWRIPRNSLRPVAEAVGGRFKPATIRSTHGRASRFVRFRDDPMRRGGGDRRGRGESDAERVAFGSDPRWAHGRWAPSSIVRRAVRDEARRAAIVARVGIASTDHRCRRVDHRLGSYAGGAASFERPLLGALDRRASRSTSPCAPPLGDQVG